MLMEINGWTWSLREELFNEVEDWFFSEPFSRDDPYLAYPADSTFSKRDDRSDESKMHERRLAKWLNKQRQLYSAGRLDIYQQQKLESLPNWAQFASGIHTRDDQIWNANLKFVQEWRVGREDSDYLPSRHRRAGSLETYMARWLRANVASFNAAVRPSRRLRRKTKRVHAMPRHRLDKFEAMCRLLLVPGVHRRN